MSLVTSSFLHCGCAWLTSTALCSAFYSSSKSYKIKTEMNSRADLRYTTVHPFTTHAGKLLNLQHSQRGYLCNRTTYMNNASSVTSYIWRDSINKSAQNKVKQCKEEALLLITVEYLVYLQCRRFSLDMLSQYKTFWKNVQGLNSMCTGVAV